MIYGAAPMAVVAGLAIVLHTWTTLQYLDCGLLSRLPRMLYYILMLGTPYLVFLIFSVGAGTFVMSQPQSIVSSNGLYCIIRLHRPALVVPSFCAAVMVIILALEDYQVLLSARHSDTITVALLSGWPLLPPFLCHPHVSLPHLVELRLTYRNQVPRYCF
ncbi:hypothetical protein V8E55_000299 [Tylopilus felleus]